MQLLETLKQPGAPEAGSAGDGFDITVLLEISFPNIVTEGETAVKAEGEFIPEHALPERAGFRIVPDIHDAPFPQVAKHPRFDLFFDAANIAGIAVPKEVTGVHVAVP
jgi:hypothetical protein